MVRLILALAISGAAITTPQERAEPPSRALLQIDAVALDSHDRPVAGLTRSDMEVWIGGYRVPIESITSVTPAGDRGRIVVLLLDDVVLPPELMPRVREAARRFLDRMAPGDRMAIVTLSGSTMELTDRRDRLVKGIDAYSVQAMGFMRADIAGEHVLKTVAALSRQIAEESAGRKVIVGIGAGWLFDAPIPPPTLGRDLRPEWTEAMRAMAFANVGLYVIDPGGIGTSPFGGSGGFARETGGYAFLNTNDLAGTADRIMREAGSYYIISVPDPPVRRKAELREMEVRALRRDLTLRARRQIPGSETPQ
jgi:VWFA-related protein